MTFLKFSAWRSITAMLSLALCLCMFTACSGDDDDDTSSSLEDNLPEDAQNYVGFWINQGSKGYDWLFTSDGVAKAYPYDRGSSTFSDDGVGYWTYNSDTYILATTIGSWQWQVTLTNDDVWAGVSLASETVQTFNREESSLYYFLAFVSGTSWVEGADSTLIFTSCQSFNIAKSSSCTGCIISTNSSINTGNAYRMQISEDDNDSDYTFTYYLRRIPSKSSYYSVVVGTGTATLKNPTSSTSAKLVFTGYLDKTLSITSF